MLLVLHDRPVYGISRPPRAMHPLLTAPLVPSLVKPWVTGRSRPRSRLPHLRVRARGGGALVYRLLAAALLARFAAAARALGG